MTWYGKAKEVAREYPHNAKELGILRETMERRQEIFSHSNGRISRPTEIEALRLLESERAQYLKQATGAVEYAMTKVLEKPNGYDTLRMYRLLYEKRTHSLMGAALELNIAYETAKRWNRYFLRMIAERMGYIARR